MGEVIMLFVILCWVLFNNWCLLWCPSSSGAVWTSTTQYFTFMGLGEGIVYVVFILRGCRSDRNLSPRVRATAQGSVGSQSLMLWLDLYLNYFLVFADACKGYNHKCVLVQVRSVRKHRFTHTTCTTLLNSIQLVGMRGSWREPPHVSSGALFIL